MFRNSYIIGINHKRADLDIREKFAFSEKNIPCALEELLCNTAFDEAVILSTCNRVEFYVVAYGEKKDDNILHMPPKQDLINFLFNKIKKYLLIENDISHSELESLFYIYSGNDVAVHLARVSSGLDSMAIGETEIFGQVKKAYLLANKSGNTGKVLNTMFQNTFSLTKYIRTSTNICSGPTSLGAVAIDLTKKVYSEFKDKRALIIGAGRMCETATKALINRGVKSFYILNRSHDNVISFIEKLNRNDLDFKILQYLEYEQKIEALAECDIIITASSAPHFTISNTNINNAVAVKSKKQDFFIIDLAVPRNVDPKIKSREDTLLYDINELKSIAEKATVGREQCIEKCEAIIKNAILNGNLRQNTKTLKAISKI